MGGREESPSVWGAFRRNLTNVDRSVGAGGDWS